MHPEEITCPGVGKEEGEPGAGARAFPLGKKTLPANHQPEEKRIRATLRSRRDLIHRLPNDPLQPQLTEPGSGDRRVIHD